MNGQMYVYFCIDSEEQRGHCAEVARDYAVPEERVFIDVYRPDSARTEYEKLCKTLTDSDTLVIERLDQLGDTLEDVAAAWRRITKGCGAAVVTAALPAVDTRRESGIARRIWSRRCWNTSVKTRTRSSAADRRTA